jgi:hypothetical protein
MNNANLAGALNIRIPAWEDAVSAFLRENA